MEKDVIGYEGLYRINDSGDDNKTVFSVKRGKYIKPFTEKRGYKTIVLYNNGEQKTHYLHRLIAEAFVDNPYNKTQVDHIIPISNGGTNEVENLRWVSPSENHLNGYTRINSSLIRRNGKRSKEVHQINENGEIVHIWESVGECGRNGFNKGHVAACCRGKENIYKGYYWKYI